MVLPGCLCQVLEPLGIHVPHHHHGPVSGWAVAGEKTDFRPVQKQEPLVPCHCDESPDRDADDCVAIACDPVPVPAQVLCDVPSLIDVPTAPFVQQRVLSNRGPPPGMPTSATMRKMICVYMV